ncbi:MAG: proline--tRNA ligase, partial [Cyanobacteria bacterium P01_H01_bin.105]
TDDGKYAANVEKAVSLPMDAVPSPFTEYKKLETPNTSTIETMSKFLDCSPTQIVKNVLYQAVYDNGQTLLVLVNIRGDQDVNDTKLQNALTNLAADYDASTLLTLDVPDADAQAQWATSPLPLGYIAPDISDDYIQKQKDIVPKFLRLVDKTAVELKDFATGANEKGYHIVGANWGDQFQLPKMVVDVRTATAGDRAVHDPNQTIQSARGIEIGHIFQLGTKYSTALGATYTDEGGKSQPLVMGCYGIGVSRLAQAAVEQSYDKNGIIWPVAIAPYHAVVVVPNINDANQMAAAEKLYEDLNAAGVETLLDDRKERAGVKFKDSELIGIPFRVVTGRSLKEGKVEAVKRADGESVELALDEVVSTVKQWVDDAIAGE